MKHSTEELLQIIHRFYPNNMWPDEAGYSETAEDHRLMAASRQAGSGADYEGWRAMLNRLRPRFSGHLHNTSLHLMAGSRGSCYEGCYDLLDTDEAKHRIYFAVSFLAPYYLVYSWRWTQAGHRFEARFELDETERPYALKIAQEIEATYGYEPMPPEVGNVLVAEVEILGARYHYFGKGTIYDYLFTINW